MSWTKWFPNPWNLQDLCVKDTGGGGQCQFLCIAEAVKPRARVNLTVAKLRKIAAHELHKMSDEEFNNVLAMYREETKHREFAGSWNPMKISSKSELADAILRPNQTG